MISAPARPECRNGHPWTEASTYISPKGHRMCRICGNANKKRRSRRPISPNTAQLKHTDRPLEPEATRVTAKWWVFRLRPGYLAEAKAMVVRLMRWEVGLRLGNEPTILLVHPEQMPDEAGIAELKKSWPDLTVRVAEAKRGEPVSETKGEFYAR